MICAEHKKDAVMQEFASREALVLLEEGQALKVLGPESGFEH